MSFGREMLDKARAKRSTELRKGRTTDGASWKGSRATIRHRAATKTGLALPLVDYPRTEGSSITGGYVYRGSRRPDLTGTYIYGDYVSRRIWALRMNGSQVQSNTLLLLAPGLISSFGEDESGELFVVTYGSSTPSKIYRFVQSTATTVHGETQRPRAFELEQNFPNPFNPATLIKYTVGGARGQGSGTSNVRLVVYDLLGREVTTLVNEQKQAGRYEVRFDGTGLASGVYVYRLTSGGFVSSRKMVLAK